MEICDFHSGGITLSKNHTFYFVKKKKKRKKEKRTVNLLLQNCVCMKAASDVEMFIYRNIGRKNRRFSWVYLAPGHKKICGKLSGRNTRKIIKPPTNTHIQTILWMKPNNGSFFFTVLPYVPLFNDPLEKILWKHCKENVQILLISISVFLFL